MKSLLTRIHTFASEKKKLVFFISFITLITYAPQDILLQLFSRYRNIYL